MRRTIQVRTQVRVGEWADLQAIADGWGVPPGTAVWIMLEDWIAGARRRMPEYGAAGLALAAAEKALRRRLRSGDDLRERGTVDGGESSGGEKRGARASAGGLDVDVGPGHPEGAESVAG